jgi:hypothetical protein
LRVKAIDQGPETAADFITNHRIANLSADRVGHVNSVLVRWSLYEADSQGSTLSTPTWRRQKRELPAGSDPAGHRDLDRQLVTALVAAGLKDGSTSTGAHARTKTVGFRPFALIWLISTLHDNPLLKSHTALRGTPWGSLARYSGQSYCTGPRASAGDQ